METLMADTIDRLAGHAYAPGQEPGLDGRWAEFVSQFDGFFFLFCTAGLMYVILSQYARHRRRRKNLEKMRAYWEEQRRLERPEIGSNPKLRYDAGFWGDG